MKKQIVNFDLTATSLSATDGYWGGNGKLPEFADSQYSHSQELLCPSCGSEYLHHLKVVIDNRDEEDGDATQITVAGCDCFPEEEDTRVSIKRVPETDVPHRRSNLSVDFRCEGCGGHHTLLLLQHKGRTFMNWDFPA